MCRSSEQDAPHLERSNLRHQPRNEIGDIMSEVAAYGTDDLEAVAAGALAQLGQLVAGLLLVFADSRPDGAPGGHVNKAMARDRRSPFLPRRSEPCAAR
jgi:hypothetical protein